MTPAGKPLALFALLAAAAPGPLRAWGSATHQWITREALARVAGDPAVAPLARDPRLRAALLGGAVAPDIMLALMPVSTPSEVEDLVARGHWIFKERRVGELLLKSARTGEAWASALGFLCHQVQDAEGDHPRGYPARKPSVLYKQTFFNEVMLDLLVLAEPAPPIAPVAVDIRALAMATRQLRTPVSEAALRRARRAFACLRPILRGFLRAVVELRSGPFLDSLGAHYADARSGIEGEPGLEALVKRTSETIRRYAHASPTWLPYVRGPATDLIEPSPAGLEQVTYDLFHWGAPLAQETGLVELLHALVEANLVRSHYLLQYLAGLWVTTEPDFDSFRVAVSQRAREGLRRRTRHRKGRGRKRGSP